MVVGGLPKSLLHVPARVYVIDHATQDPFAEWAAAGKPVPAPDTLAQKWVGDEVYSPTREENGYEISNGVAAIDFDVPPDAQKRVFGRLVSIDRREDRGPLQVRVVVRASTGKVDRRHAARGEHPHQFERLG